MLQCCNGNDVTYSAAAYQHGNTTQPQAHGTEPQGDRRRNGVGKGTARTMDGP